MIFQILYTADQKCQNLVILYVIIITTNIQLKTINILFIVLNKTLTIFQFLLIKKSFI